MILERAIFLLLVAGSFLPGQGAEAPKSATVSLDELPTRLSSFVAEERFRGATWGIEIVSLESGRTIYEHNSHKLLKPASNAKLYTSALALDRLGSEYRIKTSIYSSGEPAPNGELKGNLVVYGRGDPSFAARFNNGNYTDLLKPLVRAITQAGTRHVTGDLIGDETFFEGPPFGANWAWDDLQDYYGAEVSALSIQDNVVDLNFLAGTDLDRPCVITTLPALTPLNIINRTKTVSADGKRSIQIYRALADTNVYITGTLSIKSSWKDSVTVPNPGQWLLMLLREDLAREGVIIDGASILKRWPKDEPTKMEELKELASVESPPLNEVLMKMVKPSQNLYAQLLFLQTGKQVTNGFQDVSTEAVAVKELNRFLRKAGIPKNEAFIEEGSGLSRGCLVTPHATVQLLQYMHKQPLAGPFEAALPISGTDGSLKGRLIDLKGKVRAKTGSMHYLDTLSGYLETTAGELLAFSVMLNAFEPESGGNGRDEVDTIVRMVASLAQKTDAGPR
jgi:D-alanyl-D-alanine carboxypeptidase/D-alanyl-D-alanine-endopeptidase (penicillin-binding protein 4)